MASKRFLSVGIFAVLICCLWSRAAITASAAVGEQPGTVDPSFGENGVVLQPRQSYPPAGPYGPVGEDMAVDAQDEIFVLQSFRTCRSGSCRVEFFVQRYLPEGKMDMSFGFEGTSELVSVDAHPRPNIYARNSFGALAVGPQGEPVVAATDKGDVVVFRFDRSGHLADGFGSGGVSRFDLGGEASRPQIAVLPDERIILTVGSARRSGRNAVIVGRIQSNGRLDPTFGAGLPQVRPGFMATSGRPPGALAVAPSGAITVSGARCCTPKSVKAVYTQKRRSDGSLSRLSRGSRGHFRYLRVGAYASVSSLVSLPNGRLYLVGNSKRGLFAARLLPSGRLEATFGHLGVTRFPATEMHAGVSPAVADAARRLYVAGTWWSGEEYEPAQGRLARLSPQGRHDPRWGKKSSGYMALPFISEPLALAFQSSGKLVVFGEYTGDCVRSCLLPGRTLTRVFTGSFSSGF